MTLHTDPEVLALAEKHKFLRRALAQKIENAPNRVTGFVVVDIETTGLEPAFHDIIEIAALRTGKDGKEEKFETFVAPSKPLPAHIQNMTGIHDEMLKGAPPPTSALERFRTFVQNDVIVAHNAEFDLGFLRSHIKKLLNGDLGNRTVCTVRLSRYLYPELGNHKLGTVAQALEVVPKNQHRALGDTQTTMEIFESMLSQLSRRGCNTLEKVVALSEELGEREPAPF